MIIKLRDIKNILPKKGKCVAYKPYYKCGSNMGLCSECYRNQAIEEVSQKQLSVELCEYFCSKGKIKDHNGKIIGKCPHCTNGFIIKAKDEICPKCKGYKHIPCDCVRAVMTAKENK